MTMKAIRVCVLFIFLWLAWSSATGAEPNYIPSSIGAQEILSQTRVLGLKVRSWRLDSDLSTAFEALSGLPCLKYASQADSRGDCLLPSRLISVESHALGVLWSESVLEVGEGGERKPISLDLTSFGNHIIHQDIVAGPIMHVFRRELHRARTQGTYHSHEVFRGAFIIQTHGATPRVLHGWQLATGEVQMTRIQGDDR